MTAPCPEMRAVPSVRVSAIVAVNNGAATIGEALASIAAQRCEVVEIIVVDDGSIDGSAEVAEIALAQYGLPGKVVRLESRCGAGAARNRAVAECSGDVIAILDADDRWTSHHLANAVAMFERQADLVAYVSRVEVRDEATWNLPGRVLPEGPGYEPEGIQRAYERLLAGMNFWNVTLCSRKSAFVESGGFEETLTCYEDHWLYLNLSRAGNFCLSNQVGCVVRRRSHSLSSTGQKKGGPTMSKPMYADRIALISLMANDERFSCSDVEMASEATSSFVASEFKYACRARNAGQCALIVSAILRRFSAQPIFVSKMLFRSVWETLQFGSHLLRKKYFQQWTRKLER